jgi:ribosomal protein S17E
MTPTYTIDEALNNLVYTTKLIRLKQKLTADFSHHDRQLNCLLENIEDSMTQELIDKYSARFSEDFFSEYGE